MRPRGQGEAELGCENGTAIRRPRSQPPIDLSDGGACGLFHALRFIESGDSSVDFSGIIRYLRGD